MLGPLAHLVPLLAAKAPAPDAAGSLLTPIVMVAGVFILYQVLIGGPQRSIERKRQEMLKALKKNDRVMTSSGIYATVVSVDGDGDRVVLRVDDDKGVKMEFSRAAISQVLNADADKDKERSAAAGAAK